MNKTKKLLILCMAVVLCACCVVPSFSWYNHNGKNEQIKNAIEYKRSAMPVSGYLAGTNLIMKTYQGTLASDGEVSYVEGEGNEVETIKADRSTTAGEYNTTCYKSVIKNTSSKDVYVGLYLETADFGEGGDQICFGTSDPIWRRITAASMNTKIEAKKTPTGTMRIYYQKNDIWSESKFYIVAYSSEYNHKLYPMSTCSSDTSLYYADIPSTSTHFFVTCENSLEPSRDYRRTGELNVSTIGLTPTQSKKISLPGGLTTEGYMKTDCVNIRGANVANFVENLYLSTDSLNNANQGSVALIENTDYIGSSITYSCNKTDIATVDSSGNVTAKDKEGTAVITTTVTGEKGEMSIVETTVNVQNPSHTLPLVQNILVPKNGESAVCWYIDNKSTTKDLTDIKLMLTL